MVTYYYISDGYNSAYSRNAVWEELKRVVRNIQLDPEVICDEVRRLEPEHDPDRIREFTKRYIEPVEDLTIRIIEDEAAGRRIVQVASGCDPDRSLKEACRRAVCRLVMQSMHVKKMEINITVG